MIKIGITGQEGFVGSYLYNTIGLQPEKYERVPFKRDFFQDAALLDSFVSSCDVIIHLAAMNRHTDQEVIYQTNKDLVSQLVESLKRTGAKPHVLFSSSTQEERDNLYGKSKREGRLLIENWAKENNASFSGLIIPNVFGPFGKPFYNSVVATFCYQLTHNQTPTIDQDSVIKLVYVGELVDHVIKLIEINNGNVISSKSTEVVDIPHSKEIKVSQILDLLDSYKEKYLEKGIIPGFGDVFERNLFNTYRSYIDLGNHYPVKYTPHSDNRGSFVEIIKLEAGGQVSFSTTVPDITRGNHYHTRKIERFSVIKGEALIQLRKVNTTEILNFNLSGSEPSFVDMPIWYTHNIKNVGKEDLYTVFWINEFFDPQDADTYFETV
ncbi:epimerase [Bacteroidetes bacterium UKL13-3]|nr:epimerase [Bacteroidetes bacterium UKL13-3]HCP93949.1 epimerase [Bacteroidota bacterium]